MRHLLKLVFICLFLVFWGQMCAAGEEISAIDADKIISNEHTTSYQYKMYTGNNIENINLTIVKNGCFTEITILRGNGKKEFIQLKNETELQRADYYNCSGELYLEVLYDYQQNKVHVQGEKEATYQLKERLFDHNGALFYIFGALLPEKGQDIIFTLLQSKLSRTLGMVLKYMGYEQIEVSNSLAEAIRYEMHLASRFQFLFWPYKYYYWYSPEGTLLKYTGPDSNGNTVTISLVNETDFSKVR